MCICIFKCTVYVSVYVDVHVSIYNYIYNVRNYIYAHASMLARIHTCTQIHRCAYPHAGGALSSDGAGALLGPEFTPTDVE